MALLKHKTQVLTSQEALEQKLIELIYQDEELELEVANVRTYEDAGMMTYNKGVCIRMNDGKEFRLTIHE